MCLSAKLTLQVKDKVTSDVSEESQQQILEENSQLISMIPDFLDQTLHTDSIKEKMKSLILESPVTIPSNNDADSIKDDSEIKDCENCSCVNSSKDQNSQVKEMFISQDNLPFWTKLESLRLKVDGQNT